jgi:hypothetical protein
MFLLYSLSLGGPIVVGGPRFRPVWTHSSYATEPAVLVALY